jgi:thiamine-phosphate pyrophosphorylase
MTEGSKDPCRLYLITPAVLEPASFAAALAEALDQGGVDCVQLRLKDISKDDILRAAEILAPVVRDRDVAFIMNDFPDLAHQSGCDGVHVGQQDGTYQAARDIVGPDAIVGVTCHDSRDLAIEAANQGADYVAFGAFFPTSTKTTKHHPPPEILQAWSISTTVPSVAIGGITAENCGPLIEAGTDYLAVVSAVWDHEQGPAAAVKEFNASILRYS